MAEAVRERKLPIDDKIHTWPHLVRMEFLVALFVTVALTLWAGAVGTGMFLLSAYAGTPGESPVVRTASPGGEMPAAPSESAKRSIARYIKARSVVS